MSESDNILHDLIRSNPQLARRLMKFIFKDIVENKPGFVKAMWCGDEACENMIKEETGATSRCMPFKQEHLSDTCVCCGKPAKAMVYWGKAY